MFIQSWTIRRQEHRRAGSKFGAAVLAAMLVLLVTLLSGESRAHSLDLDSVMTITMETRGQTRAPRDETVAKPALQAAGLSTAGAAAAPHHAGCLDAASHGHCANCLGASCFGCSGAILFMAAGIGPEAGACIHPFPAQAGLVLTQPDVDFRPPCRFL